MDLLLLLLNLVLCILIADFISGIIHWVEDTYISPGKWNLFNKYIVDLNIEHHRYPSKIANDTYFNINKIGIGISSVILILLGINHITNWQPYLITIIGSQFNQIHSWAHTLNPPEGIKFLQYIGLFQSRKHHNIHHIRPFETNYCTFTNYLNPVLEKLNFWRVLESLIPFKIKRNTIERNYY